ncbi:HAMP domain-containing sensor histidine kinase [Arcobacteraceae bacterium]|nr:HAMP domain-containing sensor histidine kinase [Arcobacteraceae bacterium]
MKNYEKQSFFITLALFFIPLFLLSSVVLYMYHNEQIKDIEKNILYQMKDYSYDFKGDTFSLDIVDNDIKKEIFKIYHIDGGLGAYFQIPSKGPYLLKIIYEKDKYQKLYNEFSKKIFILAIVMFFLILVISVGFAFYSLRPIRQALHLLEEFLKDLIHDLNTPATSILLNTRLLKKRGEFPELERIEISAKGIASLYENLELMTPSHISIDEKINLDDLLVQKIELLKKIYPNIIFNVNETKIEIVSNSNAIERILDNLLTNACKYNKKNGEIFVGLDGSNLIIKDTGIGIKNTSKVFQRYYKENESGMGIGMDIVKQLCDILKITIRIESKIGVGTSIKLDFS